MTVILTEDTATAPIVAPIEAEVAIAQAEAAVEIAAIQEEGATDRAEIHAASDTANTEAIMDRSNFEEGLDECRKNIGTLQTEVQTLSSLVQSTLAALTEEVEEEQPPPNPNEPIPESGEVQNPEASEEAPEPAPKKKPRINWT